MAINWTPDQVEAVGQILGEHDINSGRCLEAARKILPIALERDEEAVIWQIWPAVGRYVVPRVTLANPWYYHATVEAESHCVDALTGTQGTHREEYEATHWKVDALRWVVDDPNEDVP